MVYVVDSNKQINSEIKESLKRLNLLTLNNAEQEILGLLNE